MDINRYLSKQESYILKDGVKTSRILQAGKREVSVLISGLHPNTKDQAVIRYLSAHGIVSQKHKIIHHVYQSDSGSSLLAGKLNGDRSYMVELIRPMGSFHIFDGEKVSVKYRGQSRTCARCHKTSTECPGKAVARECDSDRVLLSTHMEEHWHNIGFTPETPNLVEEDCDSEPEVQIGRKKPENVAKVGPDLSHRYKSVLISGFNVETSMDEIHCNLIEHGLPERIKAADIIRNNRSGKLTVEGLEPTDCISIMNKMHGRKMLDSKVFITPVVAPSPVKATVSSQHPPEPPPAPPSSLVQSHTNKLKLRTTRNLAPTKTKLSLVPVVIVAEELDNHSTADKEQLATPDIQSTSTRKSSVSEKRKLDLDSPDKPDPARPKSKKSAIRRNRDRASRTKKGVPKGDSESSNYE